MEEWKNVKETDYCADEKRMGKSSHRVRERFIAGLARNNAKKRDEKEKQIRRWKQRDRGTESETSYPNSGN